MLMHLPTPDALCSRGQNQYLMVAVLHLQSKVDYKPDGDFLWCGSVLIISLGGCSQ